LAASPEQLDRLVERLRARIGITGPTATRRIEAGALAKFARATGQTESRYLDPRQPEGAMVAPPTYLSVFCNDTMGEGLITHDLPFDMFLHTDDAVEMHAPIRAGDDITAVARYADVYLKQGRNGPMLFQIAEMRLTNQHGAEVATVRVGSVSFDAPATVAVSHG
jgi:hypothetical protein